MVPVGAGLGIAMRISRIRVYDGGVGWTSDSMTAMSKNGLGERHDAPAE